MNEQEKAHYRRDTAFPIGEIFLARTEKRRKSSKKFGKIQGSLKAVSSEKCHSRKLYSSQLRPGREILSNHCYEVMEFTQ